MDSVDDLGVGDGAGRYGPAWLLPGPVGARGDLTALLTQDSADRLDRVPSGALIVDEREDHRLRGSVKVGPGRGDNRWGCSVFPGRFPNPACTFQCTGLSTRPGQAAVVSSSSVGQGEGMTAPR